jgi:hypothetical protein
MDRVGQELRAVRAQMADAEQKGDFNEALKFSGAKMKLDRRLAELNLKANKSQF